ncbi:hypothetical protein EJ06DRAFT_578675 [Trichodelitschia bisporula]|uniref:Uncharacterized protein n=1 Tax=Trichodelitschia bisporula TaxID=703511 RepID=A0A6G1IBV6_9PEZI|nr:hypothetical protein EJ06DRAFT_578675 [Trichodelitschia bisporula]
MCHTIACSASEWVAEGQALRVDPNFKCTMPSNPKNWDEYIRVCCGCGEANEAIPKHHAPRHNERGPGEFKLDLTKMTCSACKHKSCAKCTIFMQPAVEPLESSAFGTAKAGMKRTLLEPSPTWASGRKKPELCVWTKVTRALSAIKSAVTPDSARSASASFKGIFSAGSRGERSAGHRVGRSAGHREMHSAGYQGKSSAGTRSGPTRPKTAPKRPETAEVPRAVRFRPETDIIPPHNWVPEPSVRPESAPEDIQSRYDSVNRRKPTTHAYPRDHDAEIERERGTDFLQMGLES